MKRLKEALIRVAEAAIEADDMELAAFSAKKALHSAYQEYKEERGLDRVERNTLHWELMMVKTKVIYEASEAAKRKAYNAKRRRERAIHRWWQEFMNHIAA